MTNSLAKFYPKLILALAFSHFISCGKRPSAPAPFRAEIVKASSDGYALETVQYEYLSDVDSMDGSVLKMIGHAALDADAGIEELIDPAVHDKIYLDKGRDVVLDYAVDGSVIKPRNFDSMAMLSLYYNYEVVINFWKNSLGLNLEDFGKLRMYYAPRMKAKSGAGSIEATIKVNAAFMPGARDFLIFKTSALEELPISMNQGVLAHEFGHAIFDYKFAKMDPLAYEGSSSTEEELNGINEGLADFFSYAVTGRRTEYERSLSELGSERNLPVSWTLSSLSRANCYGSFYCKGSILASALYEASLISGNSSLLVTKSIFDSFSNFRADWEQKKNSSSFDYYYFLKQILNKTNAPLQSPTCKVFLKWFDTSSYKEFLGC